MTEPTHVDGNAVGALLHDVFGADMTDRRGCCDECGAISMLATLLAYRQAPGDVLRCPACGAVIVVVVETPARVRVTFESLRWMDAAASS
ncbi:MAG TPA: DUF6510 family protein [Acidimicrobiia bacterium]|nr:DUF6510 family protein [Acidimicrobiia bacterium]